MTLEPLIKKDISDELPKNLSSNPLTKNQNELKPEQNKISIKIKKPIIKPSELKIQPKVQPTEFKIEPLVKPAGLKLEPITQPKEMKIEPINTPKQKNLSEQQQQLSGHVCFFYQKTKNILLES